MPDPYPDTACRKRGILVTQGMRITVASPQPLVMQRLETSHLFLPQASSQLGGPVPHHVRIRGIFIRTATGVRCSQVEPHASHLHGIDIEPVQRPINMGFHASHDHARPISPGQRGLEVNACEINQILPPTAAGNIRWFIPLPISRQA